MFCKHLAVFTGILALGATLATPAMAHQLTAATATSMNCTGFCLQLAADQLTPGDQDKITYTITLTSTTGGATITVTGEVDFTADSSGTFTKTVCGNWLASGLPLNDNYVASGTAVLTTPSNTSRVENPSQSHRNARLARYGFNPVAETAQFSDHSGCPTLRL